MDIELQLEGTLNLVGTVVVQRGRELKGEGQKVGSCGGIARLISLLFDLDDSCKLSEQHRRCHRCCYRHTCLSTGAFSRSSLVGRGSDRESPDIQPGVLSAAFACCFVRLPEFTRCKKIKHFFVTTDPTTVPFCHP